MEDSILEKINSNNYELLGKGFNSKSYKMEINTKKYILLQGQIQDSYKCYYKSYNNLKFLFNNGNPLIKSIKIPFDEIYLIKPDKNCTFLKYGALIYLEIEGLIIFEKFIDKINIEKITDKIALFLKELYSIPINENDINETRNKKKMEFKSDMNIIKSYFKDKNIDNINNFEKEYLDYINNFNDFHYIHGDLWEENMIISKDYQDLIGVVDFDNFCIGDIAKDYASLIDFGFEFLNILMNKNKEIVKDKNDFIKRIKIYEKLIELEDTAYILRDKNLENRLESKLKKLNNLKLIS